LLLSASYKFCPSTLLNSLGIPPLMHLLTDPLPKAWLGRRFVLMFGVSLNVIHSALINCSSFYLKALQNWMLCSATLAWYSQVWGQVYTNWGKVAEEAWVVLELHVRWSEALWYILFKGSGNRGSCS
jgi:hypothetical protein